MPEIEPYTDVFFFFLKEIWGLALLAYVYQPARPGANVETYPKIEIQFPIGLSNFNVKRLPAPKHAQLGRVIDGCSLLLVLS